MPDAEGTALLELAGVSKSFGRVVVADNLSLAVGRADVVGIAGPNGAGKTSLFGLIAGDLAPSSGEIYFDGGQITRLNPAVRCRLGIGRTFQVPKPFGGMTVFENVLVAVQQGSGLRGKASYATARPRREQLRRTARPALPQAPGASEGARGLARSCCCLTRSLAGWPFTA
jgi:ABC-type branched-subunit amino acid transport system ATPase component